MCWSYGRNTHGVCDLHDEGKEDKQPTVDANQNKTQCGSVIMRC